MNRKYDTFDGGSVEITRIGVTYDLHVRSATGETVATVTMPERQAEELLRELQNEVAA
jgi:hypothetical protein